MVENTFPVAICLRNEMKEVMVVAGFCNNYQSCLKFYNGHAHQNSEFLHVYFEKYGIFSKLQVAVQLLDRALVNEFFDPYKS
jgi:hypothetical protein